MEFFIFLILLFDLHGKIGLLLNFKKLILHTKTKSVNYTLHFIFVIFHLLIFITPKQTFLTILNIKQMFLTLNMLHSTSMDHSILNILTCIALKNLVVLRSTYT